MNRTIVLFTLVTLLTACEKTGDSPVSSKALFTILSATQTGIDFSNNIQENQEKNYFNFEYIYNGGGVALGDINNDGLVDIYFSGNEVPNRLYLNKGNLKFEDITESAGVAVNSGWKTGVSMVDINADGYLDIYVCRSGWTTLNPQLRRNLLFINKKDNTFVESAGAFGLDEDGYSVQSSFFDYDNDGDLDVYVTNHPYLYELELQERLAKRTNPDEEARDKLFRNEGNLKFTEISREAGIVNYGHGLGIVTADLDDDGLTDIYVANDYKEPDYMYMNNGDGTFTDKIKDKTGHIAFYAMGVDVADINEDGYQDILVTEMLPYDYKRSKTNMASMNVQLFEGMKSLGLHYQYMHNVLQLNHCNKRYGDIAQMIGASKTDWSWSCIMEDFDNDGLRDIFVANGYKRDVFDKDYKKTANEEAQRRGGQLSLDELYKIMPATKLPNQLFLNKGDFKFESDIDAYGLGESMLSQGGAVADLDNDGDLDIVVNNLDETSRIIRNNAQANGNNYLKIRLVGGWRNTQGLNSKVICTIGDEVRKAEIKSVRGYQSSSEPVIHIGLGTAKTVDKVTVLWFDGKSSVTENVEANQMISLAYKDASETASDEIVETTPLYNETEILTPAYKHNETEHNDYRVQVLLPHKLSQNGPFISKGDVNGDGLDDFFIGGATGFPGALYFQDKTGAFNKKEDKAFAADKLYEDLGSVLFDADGDGDLDLYVVSGGFEFPVKSPLYQDRLYINNGRGQFRRAPNSLPQILSSGQSVCASDYDRDGDIDLFVGGRVFPDHYPFPTPSYLLNNDGKGTFRDVAMPQGQGLNLAGMVTSAVFTDIDADNDDDLIVVGEWMPIKVYMNENNIFYDRTEAYGLENTTGWWNRIIETDIDADGDMDYVVGNLGLNHKFHASDEKPFHIYAGDYDGNGSYDIVLAKYFNEVQVPVRGKQCTSEQMPFINDKFPTYKEFADADVKDIIGPAIENQLHYEARMFESIILVKKDEGFSIRPLPAMAQISPVNAILAEDINGDDHIDLILAGNMYHTEAETSRADASCGVVLLGTANNDFTVLNTLASGIFVPGDVKDAVKLKGADKNFILISNNDGVLQSFEKHMPET